MRMPRPVRSVRPVTRKPASRSSSLKACAAILWRLDHAGDHAPLQEAGHALHRIAAGDLTGEIQVTSDDEMGQMLHSMRRMQDQLHQLYGTLETRVTRLHALTHLTHLISASLDLDVVLREIAQAAATLMSIPVVRIFIADEATQTLEVRASSDEQLAAGYPTTTIRFGERSAGWVAQHRRLCLSPMFSPTRVWSRTSGCEPMTSRVCSRCPFSTTRDCWES